MSFAQQTRNTARVDSRRFAQGVGCRIINDSQEEGLTGILEFIKRNNLIPASVFPTAKGIDPVNGRTFVVPIHLWETFKSLYNRTTSSVEVEQVDPTTTNTPVAPGQLASSQMLEEGELRVRREEPLIEFLQQNMVMVSLSPDMYPSGGIPDPASWDLLVDTIDVSQTMSAKFIRRTVKLEPEAKWND